MSNQCNAKLKLIDRIYVEIPDIHCKGLCSEACGPILMSKLEAKRIGQSVGHKPNFGFNADLTCDLLDPSTKRCTVYEIRPVICRLYGAVNNGRLQCPFGCEPVLSDIESMEILGRIDRIGGGLHDPD